MTDRPPSTARVVRALVLIGTRRWRNRIFGRLSAAFRKKHARPRRRATAPKRAALGSLQVVMAVLMLAGSLGMAWGLLMRMGEEVELRAVPGKLPLQKWVHDTLQQTEQVQLKLRRRGADDSPTTGAAILPATTTAPSQPSGQGLDALRREVLRRSEFMIEVAARNLAGPFGDAKQAQRDIRRTYLEKGLAGFRPIHGGSSGALPTPAAWADPARGRVLARGVGLLMTSLFLMLLFRSFAAANLDLSTPQWGVEWFFTFPVSAGAIFAARLVQVTVQNAFSWLTIFPLMSLVYLSAGWGVWAVPAAFGVTLATNATIAAIQVFGETWMRRRLSRGRLNNVIGVCTVLQMLFFIGPMAVAATPVATAWFVSVARGVPGALAALPTFLPARMCGPDAAAWPGAIALAAAGALLPLAAAAACQRMVRGGLIAESGTYHGRRGRPPRRASGGMVRGMLGKELLLLARDRSFLAQTVILPVVLCLFQVVLNPALFRAAADDLQHATAVAFGTGAYVVLMSGARLLVGEVRGLWLLYTLPQRLDKLLFRKIALWAAFGTAFATTVWVLLVVRHGHLRAVDLLNGVIALGGVAIFGCVSAGLSALGTEATTERPRVGASIIYLSMLLGGVYISAVYAPSVWQKTVIVVLFVLVACAIWQKVRERLPYLLDPTALPPPTLGLSDALIAVFAFFTVQALLTLALLDSGLDLGAVLAVSYVAAAVLVGGICLLVLWRRKVPRLREQLGLVAPRDALGRQPWARAALRGLACGLAAGAVGVAYLWLIGQVGWLQRLKDATPVYQVRPGGGLGWIMLMAVLAAPPLEEFLFRGLLFRALGRSARPWLAVAASAAVFAAVHPPISFVPVFCLGVAAALVFRSTGLLIAPVIAHMTYNTLVMAASVYLG
ncbi:MAG TPA: type II CAAX endopeptidase family protein [Phycisphaerae bacterium]|nr:type II CAAX endopeptidase family protein [Phycisphaerae bacterium]